jgi:hypothetical protein
MFFKNFSLSNWYLSMKFCDSEWMAVVDYIIIGIILHILWNLKSGLRNTIFRWEICLQSSDERFVYNLQMRDLLSSFGESYYPLYRAGVGPSFGSGTPTYEQWRPAATLRGHSGGNHSLLRRLLLALVVSLKVITTV